MRISDWSSDVCSSDLRDAIRDLAASELGLATSTFEYAETREALRAAATRIGFPLVVKPVMSSSGKGQSTVRNAAAIDAARSEEHTSELQSLMRISYAVFCLKKKNNSTANKQT